MARIVQLDYSLLTARNYIVNATGAYSSIIRDEPHSHWWWYLDQLSPEVQKKVRVATALPLAVEGVYDGEEVRLLEPVSVEGQCRVTITFFEARIGS